MEGKKCSVRVGGEGYSINSGSPCQNLAKVVRNGRPYCGIHDPEYSKEKQRKWNEQFDKKWAKERDRQQLRDARWKATEGLTLAELEQVTPGLIREALNSS